MFLLNVAYPKTTKKALQKVAENRSRKVSTKAPKMDLQWAPLGSKMAPKTDVSFLRFLPKTATEPFGPPMCLPDVLGSENGSILASIQSQNGSILISFFPFLPSKFARK